MSKVVQKRWLKLFVAVLCLVLAQVAWWTDVFFRDVNIIAQLTTENAILKNHVSPESLKASVESTAFHRRFMFLSESISFALLAAFGLYLLFRALRSEERSRETQRNFIETVTHESKTPLTALKLRLESTLEKNSGQPGLSRELTQSLEEVRRLSSIFEKALNLNRLERYDFNFEEISLSDVVKEVARRMEPLLRAKTVNLELNCEPETWVRGDSYGLQNTVQSLLENAVLYNDKEKKEVSISVSKTSEQVLLSISDNGPGISEADSKHLFERFYRGKSSRRVPGTGLGLYLARYIVEAHAGAIRLVKSTGVGSAFEVSLPHLGGLS